MATATRHPTFPGRLQQHSKISIFLQLLGSIPRHKQAPRYEIRNNIYVKACVGSCTYIIKVIFKYLKKIDQKIAPDGNAM